MIRYWYRPIVLNYWVGHIQRETTRTHIYWEIC